MWKIKLVKNKVCGQKTRKGDVVANMASNRTIITGQG